MPVTFFSAEATYEKWAEIDGCTDSSVRDDDGCSHHDVCRNGAELIFCKREGVRDEIGDASVAWPVLKRHALPTP